MSQDGYWTKHRVSRRGLLRGAVVGGAGLAGAALIGCGGGDDEAAPAATAAGTAKPAGTAAATAAPAAIKRGGVLKDYWGGDPPSIDPYGNLSYQTKYWAARHYSRLMMRDTKPWPFPGASTGVKGDLAESLETEDGITWVAKLRPGAKFQNVAPVNGREVTSADVAFSWGRLTAAEAAGAKFVEFVERMDVIDDKTVKFTLKDVSPVFPETLADTNILFIMPTESDGKFDPATTSIGSGPWTLDEYRTSEVFTMNANPDWYFDGVDGKPLPYTDRWELAVIPEYQNQLAQLEAGNIMELGVKGDDLLGVKDRHPDFDWRFRVSQLQSIVYFSNAQTTDKAWGDDRVRKAISMAMDRATLLDLAYNVTALKAGGLEASEAWNNIVPAGMTKWWLDPQSAAHGESGKWFNYDLAEVTKLLEAAGYPGLEFTFHYTNRYGGSWVPAAEATHLMFVQAGMKPTTVVEDYNAVYITQTFRGEFEGVAMGYETPFPEVGSYFPREFGDDPANHGKIHDATIDDLTAKQAKELDEEQRRDYIYEIQRVNATNMYYAPHPQGGGTNYTAWQPEVKGARETLGYGTGAELMPYLWLDV